MDTSTIATFANDGWTAGLRQNSNTSPHSKDALYALEVREKNQPFDDLYQYRYAVLMPYAKKNMGSMIKQKKPGIV
eukprot:CAMPEP_0171318832 /NCGR_PEP_ID=MMETSP0816-20121228/91832_1 /TAXON_ID=420281 /ORGANISM="Proboscia inermis, Strain CCAP1064/1" /LENGTH=75 /DNA_ID=CAMNT_0011813811 /DNA_START=48 /DNA_END=275 /DNA_ORIENTATION=-